MNVPVSRLMELTDAFNLTDSEEDMHLIGDTDTTNRTSGTCLNNPIKSEINGIDHIGIDHIGETHTNKRSSDTCLNEHTKHEIEYINHIGDTQIADRTSVMYLKKQTDKSEVNADDKDHIQSADTHSIDRTVDNTLNKLFKPEIEGKDTNINDITSDMILKIPI